jgi:predicted dienelactone hydrolase
MLCFFVTIYFVSFQFLLSCSGFEQYPIVTGQSVWRDYSRKRDIPVKFFLPAVSKKDNSNNTCAGFPVILFSHGLGGTYDRCSYLSRMWSSFGFIVISVQHPGSDERIWRGKIRFVKELRDSYEQNWNCRTRAEDLRFVLDNFERLLENGKIGQLRVNINNVGVSGYDIGSLAPLLLSGQMPPDQGTTLRDERVKAVVAMSPPVRNPGLDNRKVYAEIKIPALFITGTKDNGIIGVTKAHQRRIPFDYMTSGDRYLVIFNNGDHQVYAGALFSISNLFRRDSIYQTAITHVSSYFWLAHLAKEKQAKEILNSYQINALFGNIATVEKYIQPEIKSKPKNPILRH